MEQAEELRRVLKDLGERLWGRVVPYIPAFYLELVAALAEQ